MYLKNSCCKNLITKPDTRAAPGMIFFKTKTGSLGIKEQGFAYLRLDFSTFISTCIC